MPFGFFKHQKQRSKVEGQGSIVVGRKARQPLSVWRKTYIVGCVLVIIGACIASFFLWRANSHARRAKFDTEGPVQLAVLQQAARDDHAGRYDDEATVLKNYLKSNPPQKYRYEPLMILGNLAYNKRDDSGAVRYYKEAIAANDGKLTAFDAASIAQAAQSDGDKAMAVQYYKQAIKLTKVEPGVANNVDEYKQIIRHLGGTP